MMAYPIEEEYCSELGRKLLEDHDYADVILVVGKDQRRIVAHKCILSAASQYFKTLFAGAFKEANDEKIILEDIPSETLHILVHFIYTGELRVDSNNVFELVVHANYLFLKEAEDLGWEYIKDHLDVSNVHQYYVLAEKMGRSTLMQNCKSFIVQNFMKFTRTEAFLEADVNLLSLIIRDNILQTPSESDVFHATRMWVNHNPVKREPLFLQLLTLVRLPLLTSQFIAENVVPVCLCVKTKDYLRDGLLWHLLEDRSSITSQNASPRAPSNIK